MTAPPPYPVSIHPAQLEVHPDIGAKLLKRLNAPDALGDLTSYLGPLHVGLLALLYDLGAIPAPERLASSRDITPLVHSLADLESLGLARRPAGDPGGLMGAPDAMKALGAALRWYWEEEARVAAEALDGAQAVEARPRASEVWRWLRVLALQVAARGVRLTRSGQLHMGDLRSLQSACELPSGLLLGEVLETGVGLEILWPVEGRLLIGDAVDLLDLPPSELAGEALRGWVGGMIPTWQPAALSLLGLLQRWGDPLREALGRSPALVLDGEALERGLMSDLAIEPCSALLEPERLAGLEGLGLVQLGEATRRHRAGLLSLLAGLPRGRALPWGQVARLVHAHASLDLLARPCAAPRPEPMRPVSLVAGATRLLPFMRARTRRDLPELVEGLLGPHGLASATETHLTVLEAMGAPSQMERRALPPGPIWRQSHPSATPPAPQAAAGRGRLIFQPSGEILAPPDASIHVLLHLAQGVTIERLDQMSSFQVTRRSLMRVADAGMSLETWAEALAELTRLPLPETVLQLIDDVARRQGELGLTPAGGVLIARDPVRLTELLSHTAIADHVLLQPSPTVAVLAQGCPLEELMEAIGDRGFSVIFTDRVPPIDGG